ncbi:hypothetical protein BHE74_00013689 [Ensete ventricosum]|uniref:Uncharacterized protein n=1 Tax=Ensete ventricosum TaxID=4639 RepID=A0A444DFW1_ENSVE|nr:hypothetical protein GW17_00040240 [Ensete ventricosum]RWW78109.1 hypothetical protein BHE74_00013689 [Ensete ventricosum]RZR70547.1 hypothetical protein BHM03_00000424 [Ensete ventricosum]
MKVPRDSTLLFNLEKETLGEISIGSARKEAEEEEHDGEVKDSYLICWLASTVSRPVLAGTDGRIGLHLEKKVVSAVDFTAQQRSRSPS